MTRLQKAADFIESEIEAAKKDGADLDYTVPIQIVAALRESKRTDLGRATWFNVFNALGFWDLEWSLEIAQLLDVEKF